MLSKEDFCKEADFTTDKKVEMPLDVGSYWYHKQNEPYKPEISKDFFSVLMKEIVKTFEKQVYEDGQIQEELSEEDYDIISTRSVYCHDGWTLVKVLHALMRVPENDNSLIWSYLYANNLDYYDFSPATEKDLDDDDRLVYGKSFEELYDIIIRERR